MIGQGRFNETLAALANARDQAQAIGKTVDVANITVDICRSA